MYGRLAGRVGTGPGWCGGKLRCACTYGLTARQTSDLVAEVMRTFCMVSTLYDHLPCECGTDSYSLLCRSNMAQATRVVMHAGASAAQWLDDLQKTSEGGHDDLYVTRQLFAVPVVVSNKLRPTPRAHFRCVKLEEFRKSIPLPSTLVLACEAVLW